MPKENWKKLSLASVVQPVLLHFKSLASLFVQCMFLTSRSALVQN